MRVKALTRTIKTQNRSQWLDCLPKSRPQKYQFECFIRITNKVCFATRNSIFLLDQIDIREIFASKASVANNSFSPIALFFCCLRHADRLHFKQKHVNLLKFVFLLWLERPCKRSIQENHFDKLGFLQLKATFTRIIWPDASNTEWKA